MASSSTFQISNRTNFSKALRAQGAAIVALRAEQIGILAQRNAEVEARSLFGDRPSSRRNVGRLHYRTNFYHRTSGASFPIRITVGNRAQHAAIIEKGQKAHKIGQGRRIAIPGTGFKGNHDGVQPADRASGPPWTVIDSRGGREQGVDHPGSKKGQGLMHRAVNDALRAYGINRGVTEIT